MRDTCKRAPCRGSQAAPLAPPHCRSPTQLPPIPRTAPQGRVKHYVFVGSAGAYAADSTEPMHVEGDKRKASAGARSLHAVLCCAVLCRAVLAPRGTVLSRGGCCRCRPVAHAGPTREGGVQQACPPGHLPARLPVCCAPCTASWHPSPLVSPDLQATWRWRST